MKKVMLSLALVTFIGATTVSYATVDNSVAIEKKDEKKKKKKKGKACCADKKGEDAKGCCKKGEAKSCGEKKDAE